jgi:hypothetical protein
MAKKANPRLAALTYDALLKSFWRKGSLKLFLRNFGIKDNFLSVLDENETKRRFLDRLFQGLQDHPKGADIILSVAKALSEQTSFPDLMGWEDSTQKIEDAEKAVQALRTFIKVQDEK